MEIIFLFPFFTSLQLTKLHQTWWRSPLLAASHKPPAWTSTCSTSTTWFSWFVFSTFSTWIQNPPACLLLIFLCKMQMQARDVQHTGSGCVGSNIFASTDKTRTCQESANPFYLRRLTWSIILMILFCWKTRQTFLISVESPKFLYCGCQNVVGLCFFKIWSHLIISLSENTCGVQMAFSWESGKHEKALL